MTMGRTCGADAASLGRVANQTQLGVAFSASLIFAGLFAGQLAVAQKSQERQRLLAREADHRVKNIFANPLNDEFECSVCPEVICQAGISQLSQGFSTGKTRRPHDVGLAVKNSNSRPATGSLRCAKLAEFGGSPDATRCSRRICWMFELCNCRLSPHPPQT